MNTQLVFVGYHRSGTSAVTQNFAKANLFVGEILLEAKTTNPYGHFEDVEFLAINRSILESNYLNWKLKNNPVPVIRNEVYDNALDLIAKRDSCFSVWGFKDPRSCLFLDFWHSVLRNPKYVITLRHFSSCIDSIMRRTLYDYYVIEDQIQAENNKLDLFNYNSICINWCIYMSSVLAFISLRNPDILVLNIDEINQDISIIDRCNQKFGTQLKSIKLSDTFDNNAFKRQNPFEYNINPDILRIANNIWNQLLSIV